MKEYDIFLPLRYNDGSPVEAEKFQQLQAELLERFGGVTYFPQPNQGYWKLGTVTYRDEIVIYRVLTGSRGARRFLLRLKDPPQARVSSGRDSHRRAERRSAVKD